MRLGVFGGSFDPVHLGHLLLAETCREACQLDQVWFVPAAAPPHKRQRARAADQDRWAMVQLAVADWPHFVACGLELERGGISYTVETLESIQGQCPGAELFFLMGADSLRDFPTWRSPERILELATLAVVTREGSLVEPQAPFWDIRDGSVDRRTRWVGVEMPRIDLSSSELRERVRAGRSIRCRTPPQVAQYIERQGVYCVAESALETDAGPASEATP